MEAIILAGGFGTRLRHIVKDVPKPMANVNYKPFLRYILSYLKRNKINKVILATGYKSEIIEKYFENEYHGIEILYSVEKEPLGTGGAIKKALEYCNDEDVFIINGDTYFDVDLISMKKFHKSKKSLLTIATKKMNQFNRYGNILFDEEKKIKFFQEKRFVDEGNINGGVYIISKTALDYVSDTKFSFEKIFMEANVGKNCFYSFESNGYFIDIGIPEDYERAQNDFKNFEKNKNKALFLDRDGTINIDNGYTHKLEDLNFIESIPKLISTYNKTGYKVIVITNQAGIARGYYSVKEMHNFHKYMDQQLEAFDAYIDAYYYCPHHPEFTGKCKCRKPNTKMIEDAIEDFNIDIKESILIGDTKVDVETGEKLGIKSYITKDAHRKFIPL